MTSTTTASRNRGRLLACVIHVFVLATILPLVVHAQSPKWTWKIDGRIDVYNSKSAALEAMRAISAEHAFLTEEQSISVTDTEQRYKYTALPTDSIPDGDWEYTYDGVNFVATEASAFDVMKAAYSNVCGEAWGEPVEGWQNLPGHFYLGLPTRQSRRYKMHTQSYSPWTDPHCSGQLDYDAWLSRKQWAKCPVPYQANGGGPPYCVIDRSETVIGKKLSPCDSNVESPLKGNPCDASSGDKTETETDWSGSGLSFVRSYHSLPADSSARLGSGWTHSYHRVLVKAASDWGLVRGDGRVESLSWRGSYFAGTSANGIVVRQASPNWIAYLKDGSREIYDANGRLLEIHSKGQVTTLSYTGNQLTSVSGPFGHTLQFQYENARLKRVIDPAGRTIEYSYDTATNTLTQVAYPDGTTRTYHYEDSAFPTYLTGITDQAGVRYSTFAYDSDGLAISTTHIGGAGSYSFSYGATSTTVTDPLGTNSTYQFTNDGLSRRVTSYSIGGLTRSAVVPSAGTDFKRRITSSTDERGIVTSFTYDQNHLLSKTEAVGTPVARITTYQYNSSDDDLPTLVTEPNRSTSYSYDSVGNKLTKTVSDTSTSATRSWSWSYDGYGRVLTEDGPRTDVSDVTTYTYYTCTTGAQCGQLHTVTNGLNQTTTLNTYNGDGQPLTMTDANGVVTTLTYDERQRVTSRAVGSETTTFTYWPTGLLKKVTQPNGSFLLHTYDAAHRLTRIEDGEGNRIEYTLDGMGNRTAENSYDPSNSLARIRTQVFNSLNQLWKQVGAAGTAAVTTAFGYDNNGNQTSVDAPLGRDTANVYDELNRLKQITDAASGITQFAYDANDKLTGVTDPRGKVTNYTYNGLGDLTELVSPDTGTTSSTYDSGGNLATRTDARNKTGTYSYDELSRVTEIAYPDQTTTFTYDSGTYGVGRLSGASDANHSLGFTYDALGRVTGKSQTVGSITKSVGYGYTSGNLTSVTTPSGQTIAYGYTEGRVTSVTLNGSTTILDQVLYDPFGPVSGWRWGNGTFAARVYDTDGKATTIDSAGALDYGYDDAFRVTSITDATDSSRSWSYGYDLLDRLNSAAKTGETIGYTYDANGNRLTQTGTQTATYTISSTSNRIDSITGTPARTYGYDAAGNTTSDGTNTYTYNDAGRLKTATRAGVTTTYVYNALGQRVKKSNASTTRYFAYDESGHLVGEYDGAGALIQETVWLNDIPVATLRPNGVGVSVYYVHTDHLNTPRRISRPSDNVIVWRWDSDPFGTTTTNEDPDGDTTAFAYNLRFPGQYSDAESGTNHNYFRTYDPTAGRYAESDPIGLEGGANTFAYVHGNPIGNVDPLGLFTSDQHAAITYEVMVSDMEMRSCLRETLIGVVELDFIPGSQAVSSSHLHSMARAGQSEAAAADQANNYVYQQISMCDCRRLGYALHTIQDSASWGHQYQTYKGWVGLWHIIGDYLPSSARRTEAMMKSRNVIAEYKKRCMLCSR